MHLVDHLVFLSATDGYSRNSQLYMRLHAIKILHVEAKITKREWSFLQT